MRVFFDHSVEASGTGGALPLSASRQFLAPGTRGVDSGARRAGCAVRLPMAGETRDLGGIRITAVAVEGGDPFYVIS